MTKFRLSPGLNPRLKVNVIELRRKKKMVTKNKRSKSDLRIMSKKEL